MSRKEMVEIDSQKLRKELSKVKDLRKISVDKPFTTTKLND
jgi:hypothetical protein